MARIHGLETTVLELIEQSVKNIKASPLNLGGVAGSDGGTGTTPGGFIGRLPQKRVTYDTTEAATLFTPSSGQSLVDNLNHIRYRLNILESGGSITVVDDTTPSTYYDVDTIHFSGAIVVDDLGSGDVRVTITASGGGGDFDLPAAIVAAPEKSFPHEDDLFAIADSQDGFSLKNVPMWGIQDNIFTLADTYYDVAGAASTVQTNLTNHISDTTDAHAASAITNTPGAGISATDVQTALYELGSEKLDVTTFSDGWIAKLQTWTARTQAFTNDPAAGDDIVLNVANTEGARIGGEINVTSSAGNEDAIIVAIVANTSITVNTLALNHTTTSRLITFYNSFTLSGDFSADADYQPGVKVKCTNNSTTVYGIISDNVHVSGTTYITLIGNTDYSITNAAISAPYISKIFKPDGFPGEFNYVPVWTSLSVGNGSVVAVWADLGGAIKQRGRLIFGSTTSVSGAVTVNTVSPTASYPSVSRDPIGIVVVRDDSANRMYVGQTIMTTPTIAMRMLNISAATYPFQQNFSATVPVTWAVDDEILFVADYFWR